LSLGGEECADAVIASGAVPGLIAMINSPYSELGAQAIWALGNLAGESARCQSVVLQAGALLPLVEFLERDLSLEDLRISTWALRHLCESAIHDLHGEIGFDWASNFASLPRPETLI
jgi:importin subunit alpha-1